MNMSLDLLFSRRPPHRLQTGPACAPSPVRLDPYLHGGSLTAALYAGRVPSPHAPGRASSGFDNGLGRNGRIRPIGQRKQCCPALTFLQRGRSA